MTKIKAAMRVAGHRVDADGPITELTLQSYQIFVVGEPTATPAQAELDLLRRYVNGGGMLLLFADTGINLSTYNNFLTGIGSSIAFTSTTIGTTSALADNRFTQGPAKVTGNTLTVSSGNGTSGGTLIDNNYVRYEQIGLGYVLVFGDRIDHDDVISDTNTKLLVNIADAALDPAVAIPTTRMATLMAITLILACIASVALRRRPVPA